MLKKDLLTLLTNIGTLALVAIGLAVSLVAVSVPFYALYWALGASL